MALIGVAVLVVGIFTCILYAFWRFLVFRWKVNKLPGPRTYFLDGNLHQISVNPDDFFEQATGISVMYQRPRLLRVWLTVIPYVTVYGAEEIEPILGSNKHLDKSRDYTVLEPWMGQGLLTSKGAIWRHHRKLLTPTFHSDILKEYLVFFNEQGKILLEKLQPHVGEQIDMYPYIKRCALDIICLCAMGKHANAQSTENDYVEAVHVANRLVFERQRSPWFWNDYIYNWFGKGKKHDEALKILHGFTEKVVKERWEEIRKAGGANNLAINEKDEGGNSNGGKTRLAFLDLLLDMVERNELPFEEVRDEVDTFMFAGHDTTGTAMNWLLHLIGCHPEVQARIHSELDEVFGGEDRNVTMEDLKKMTYLECCIKEALRLYPSAPMFARTLGEDTNIGGYIVPKGLPVIINPYMVHRDPKHWPDPERFDPDRFLPQNANGRHPYAYVPFSAGSRNCLGQRFSVMESKTLISWILRFFTIRSLERRDQVRVQAEMIIRPTQSVTTQLSLRRKVAFG